MLKDMKKELAWVVIKGRLNKYRNVDTKSGYAKFYPELKGVCVEVCRGVGGGVGVCGCVGVWVGVWGCVGVCVGVWGCGGGCVCVWGCVCVCVCVCARLLQNFS